MVECIASTPAVYAAPYLSRSTSRCTSSVRYICTCGGVNAPAPAVYAEPAPPVECIASGTISVLRRASTGTVYSVPAPVSYASLIATATGCFGSLPAEPTVYTGTCGGLHRDGTIGTRGTCTCRGLHRASTFRVCYTCTFGDVHRAGISSERCTSPIVEHIAPAQAVSYAEEILSRRHMSDDVFLRQGVESNALLSLSWSIPFILFTRCR